MQKQRLQIMIEWKYLEIIREFMRNHPKLRNESQAIAKILWEWDDNEYKVAALKEEIKKRDEKIQNIEYELKQKLKPEA